MLRNFAALCDENLKLFESALEVTANLRDGKLEISGESEQVQEAARVIKDYNTMVREGTVLRGDEIQSLIRTAAEERDKQAEAPLRGSFSPMRGPRSVGRKQITPKGLNQRRYIEALESFDMVFAIGPGGTGKTYLAVAMAVSALLSKQVNRIILARPAVEAGERLGFLPGTLQEKVDPYMRPLYDALYDLLESDKLERFLEKGIIEVAPLAFMRGRTLNDSFVILDEAQNTTSEQMKMFLTRLGFNSKAVITGDITQIDLPSDRRSGLIEAIEIVSKIDGIAFIYFDERDVVRHTLVQRIIKAYDEHGASQPYIPGRGPAGAATGTRENPRAATGLNPLPMVLNQQKRVRVRVPPMERFLARVLRHLRLPAESVTVCFAKDAEVARWNRKYRGKSGSTDVLSFPAASNGSNGHPRRGPAGKVSAGMGDTEYLGDIAISPVVARRNAERCGHPLAIELQILILHGVLHLLGYDHETDRGEMERFENRLRARFELA